MERDGDVEVNIFSHLGFPELLALFEEVVVVIEILVVLLLYSGLLLLLVLEFGLTAFIILASSALGGFGLVVALFLVVVIDYVLVGLSIPRATLVISANLVFAFLSVVFTSGWYCFAS